MTKLTALGGALAALLALGGSPAAAETARAAIWLGAGSPNGKFFADWTARIAENTGGSVSFDVFPGGMLLPPEGSLSGLESGVADLVFVTAGYIPSDLPLDNVLGDAAFVSESQLELALATLETKLFHPKMVAEYQAHNAVYAADMAIGVYNFQCNFDAVSLADLKGRKIRTIGGAHVDWVNHIGAVSVSVPGTEIYSGLQRGSIDCTTGTPLFLTDFFKLSEVVKSVNMAPMGSLDTGGFFFNGDYWAGLSPEERRAIFDSSAEMLAKAYVEWQANIDHAFEVAREAGVEIRAPSEADLATLAAFRDGYLEQLPAVAAEERRVEDPTDLVQSYLAAIDKYAAMIAAEDLSDEASLAAFLKREIFDRIDVETYGIY